MISPLRQRMIEDMNARKLSEGSRSGATSALASASPPFSSARRTRRAADDVRRFQLHLIEDGASSHNRNRAS
jgi:hypothetical protein